MGGRTSQKKKAHCKLKKYKRSRDTKRRCVARSPPRAMPSDAFRCARARARGMKMSARLISRPRAGPAT